MNKRAIDIKWAINRLIEPRRVQQRKKVRDPAARPSVPGRIGAAERVTRFTPT